MVQLIPGTIYTCGCGYVTLSSNCASKHSKTKKCLHNEMTKEDTFFVREKDYNNKGTEINTDGDHNIIGDHNNVTNITINLNVPGNLWPAISNKLKNDTRFVNDLRGANMDEIPSVIFQYTRGTRAENPVIKYDMIKGSVIHKDPVTGMDVNKDLKKYRNEYLVESSTVLDINQNHWPDNVKRNVGCMTIPDFPTGKKKDYPITATEVIKICASGDHAKYKMPFETSDFYSRVANNVDTEIKRTGL